MTFQHYDTSLILVKLKVGEDIFYLGDYQTSDQDNEPVPSVYCHKCKRKLCTKFMLVDTNSITPSTSFMGHTTKFKELQTKHDPGYEKKKDQVTQSNFRGQTKDGSAPLGLCPVLLICEKNNLSFA